MQNWESMSIISLNVNVVFVQLFVQHNEYNLYLKMALQSNYQLLLTKNSLTMLWPWNTVKVTWYEMVVNGCHTKSNSYQQYQINSLD